MYKNIICFFSFPFITWNVRTGRVRESRRRLSCIHWGQGVNLRWNLFCFRSKTSWLYNIPDTYANSRGHKSNLPLTRYTWICLLLACHPRNLRGISAENTCVLLTLGTWCISCYFCSQGSTSAVTSTNVLGVFKSISNIECEETFACRESGEQIKDTERVTFNLYEENFPYVCPLFISTCLYGLKNRTERIKQ